MISLDQRFAQVLDAHRVALCGQTVLVAVSGGADSVALLRLFCAVRLLRGCRLVAAHLHHGIRGEEADGDAAFVRDLCEQLDVPLHTAREDIPARAARAHAGLEETARLARRAFLEQVRAQIGADWVALAHHMEDQAETVLLHMIRGSGATGLSGMRPVQGRTLRPLLGFHRQEMRAYLQALGQPWREDSTNRDETYARNYVRHSVLPPMGALNPGVARALAGLAERIALDDDCLWAQARAAAPYSKATPYGMCLNAVTLLGTPEAVRRRMLLLALADGGIASPQARHVAALCALLNGPAGQSDNLPQGWRAMRGRAHLHLLSPSQAPPPAPVPLALWGETPAAGGGCIHTRPALPGELGDGLRQQALDADAVAGAVVRCRQSGDTFRMLGAPGARLLRRVMMDKGIDRPLRDTWPLVAQGSRVLWIPGVGPAQDAAITPQTRSAVHCAYLGKWPWEA
ncbi:MAG: tRNA lysidine(34) synthetase TilS [Oscillospiraceae bacterium]|jgi:tRNA(Ile)-lysidine synthase|nr:tRNA lysidine(34) synthetase TilS [Oscillospiraceae bacterium]